MKTPALTRNSVARITLIFILGIAAIFLYSCSKPGRSGKTRIGVILPMTGILAEMGQYEKQAMQLGLEQLNREGKSDIELIFEDGKGDNKAVAAAANKLLDIDHARLLITSTTGASLTTQPISGGQHVPLLAFCMGSDVAPKSPYTVRFYIGFEEEAAALMAYLSKLPRDTKIGVLHANVAAFKTVVADLYSPFLQKTFAEPPTIEEYALNDKDFRSQLTKIKSAGVQTLILLGYGFEYPAIFSQMDGLAMRQNLRIAGGWGFLYTQLPPSTLEGIVVAGPTYVFHADDSARVFQDDFEKRYGRPANFDAAFAYEVIKQLPKVLQIVDQNGAANIKHGLQQLGTVNGTFGNYSFTADGNMIAEAGIGVFRNGRIVPQ